MKKTLKLNIFIKSCRSEEKIFFVSLLGLEQFVTKFLIQRTEKTMKSYFLKFLESSVFKFKNTEKGNIPIFSIFFL